MQIRPLAMPPLAFRDAIHLAPARMHEAGGPGRYAFAACQAMRHPGPIFWISRAHEQRMPFMRGFPADIGARFYLLRTKSDTDLLWTVEESLRAGPVGLVIAEPEKPLSLTAGRLVQLAAE